ncbi:MAG TPA: N-acetylglucosamine-6-phosphate deacetylase [Candidatus Limnocylindria bacterium]|nr:N-acetylglucosamine-6-phosphate deacetylase [Candidatus Limnocylindria bacterium]
MTATAIYAAAILTPHEELRDCVILVEDGKIIGLGPRDEVRVPADAVHYAAGDKIVVPGFVDIHIHGAGGHDVMEGNARALDRIAATVARYGTTSILATTVTAPMEDTCHSLQGIARYIRHHEAPGDGTRPAAEILGIHLEGPFISKARRGVHPQDAIVRPSAEALAKFREAADGLIKIVTIAPELPGALELISAAVAEGLVVAIGHTDADYDETRAAFAAGARHAVHFYNAMRPFTHRDPGVIGAVLTEPEMTAEVIADGVHVSGPAIQVLIGTKGFHTVLLASDGTAATGMHDGTYRLGTTEVIVKGGVCRNSEGKLAGSTLTLDRALRYLVELGVPLIEAVRMATVLPARRIGLAGKKGIIAIGGDADLVVLSQDLRVEGVMTRGVGLA